MSFFQQRIVRPIARHWWKAGLLATGVVALAAALVAAYLASDSFQRTALEQVVSGVDKATGGRLEMKSLHVAPWQLSFEANDVMLHGREPQGATPLFHADRITGTMRLLTLVGDTKAGLQSLKVEHPKVHIVVLADGSSNLPVPPPAPPTSAHQKVQQLFQTVLGDVTLNDGELHWNDRTIPLQLRAHNVEAGLSRSLLERTFTGKIGAEFQEARGGDLDGGDAAPPVSNNAAVHRVAGKLPTRSLLQGRMDCQFTIGDSSVRLDSLKMTSPRSKLAASGAVTNLDDPTFDGTYEASVNLAELGIASASPKFAGGEMGAKGDLHLSAKAQSSTGGLTLRELDWRGDTAKFNRVLAQSKYQFDGERLLLSQVAGSGPTGSVWGSGEILLTTKSLRKQDRGRPIGSGRMHLNVDQLELPDLLDDLKDADTVVGRRLVATLKGTADIDWLDSDHGTIAVQVEARPPAEGKGGVPLEGSAAGVVTFGGVVRVQRLDMRSGSSTVSAQGTFGESGTLNFHLRSSEVDELHSVLVELGWLRKIEPAAGTPPGSQPNSIRGDISFDGSLAGTAQEPIIAGHLASKNLLVRWPAAGSGERVAHFDTLNTDLRFEVSELSVQHAELRMGTAAIRFDAELPLTKGSLNRDGPLTLHAVIDRAHIEELAKIAGKEIPVQGVLQAQISASGTLNDPRGEGSMTITDAMTQGIRLDHASARLLLSQEELQFHDLQAGLLQGSVSGEAALQMQMGALRYDLRGSGLQLGGLPAMGAMPMKPSGTLDFMAQGSGKPESPILEATFHVKNLVTSQGKVGDFTLAVNSTVAHGSPQMVQWRVHGESNFGGPKLAVEGTITPGGLWQSQLDARFSDVDLEPLIRAAMGKSLSGRSSVAGVVHLAGPLARQQELEASGEMSQFLLDVQNLKLQSDGPVKLHLAKGRLEVERVRLTGEGSNLSAGGTVELRGERRIDLKAEGQVNLHLVEAFYPELVTSGVVVTNMRITGTLDNPTVQGRVQIDDAGLSYADLPSGLNHIKGSLLFNQDRLQVESLTAQTGAGELRLGGEIGYRNGLDFRLTATGKDVRLRYPPGLSATGDADLQMNGTPDNSTLSGRITITKLTISPRFDLGAYLAKSKQSTATPSTPITGLKLNIRLATVPELDLETGLGKLSGDADLRIQGTAGRPVVLGRINVVEGEVVIASSTYRIEHGEILFNNPVRLEPVLDLSATARVRDYDITLGLHGTPDKLTVNYRSDPPLPTSDIIALLALGRTRQDTGIASSRPLSLDENTTNAILEEAKNATASSRVQRLFGGARIKIDPGAGGIEGGTSGARLTIEQQLSNKLTLTYITNVSQTQQQIVQVEYSLPHNISLVGIRDANSVVGFDVRVRQRRK